MRENKYPNYIIKDILFQLAQLPFAKAKQQKFVCKYAIVSFNDINSCSCLSRSH